MENKILDMISDLKVSQAEIASNQKQHNVILARHTDLLEKQGEVLLRNTISVEDHDRRSQALEEQLNALRGEVYLVKTAWESHIAKSKTISVFMEKMAAYAGWVAAVVVGFWQIYLFLKSKGF